LEGKRTDVLSKNKKNPRVRKSLQEPKRRKKVFALRNEFLGEEKVIHLHEQFFQKGRTTKKVATKKKEVRRGCWKRERGIPSCVDWEEEKEGGRKEKIGSTKGQRRRKKGKEEKKSLMARKGP